MFRKANGRIVCGFGQSWAADEGLAAKGDSVYQPVQNPKFSQAAASKFEICLDARIVNRPLIRAERGHYGQFSFHQNY